MVFRQAGDVGHGVELGTRTEGKAAFAFTAHFGESDGSLNSIRSPFAINTSSRERS